MNWIRKSVSMDQKSIDDYKFIEKETGASRSGAIRALAAKEVKRIKKEKEAKK